MSSPTITRVEMPQAAQAYPDVELDVYTGDLEEGQAIVERMPSNAYDCIISRGGTASLIRKVTDLPVVDINISVYDVLRTMKLAENYSSLYAIVGFPAIASRLLNAIEETGLSRRVRLLFSCSVKENEAMPEVMRTVCERLGYLTLPLPSLRSRSDEIPSLASLYLNSLNLELGKQLSGFEPRALEDIISEAVRQTVAAHGGNRAAAARQLGISRTTLWRHLGRLGEEHTEH